MNTFNLYERPDGRIVINADVEPKSRFLRTITAANWKAARAQVGEQEFFHDYGHGYFAEPRPSAYPRQREYHERVSRDRMRELMMIAGLNELAIRPKKLTSRSKEFEL